MDVVTILSTELGWTWTEENDWLLLWEELPHRAFPVGASFLIVVGTTKGLVLIGSKTLRVFSSAFFKEGVLSIFYQLRLEKRSRPEGRVPQLLTSRFPQMGMKEGHFSFSS